jgi:hypothetical protein
MEIEEAIRILAEAIKLTEKFANSDKYTNSGECFSFVMSNQVIIMTALQVLLARACK